VLLLYADWHALTSDYADTGISGKYAADHDRLFGSGTIRRRAWIFSAVGDSEHAELHLLFPW
jgi:hypothetical protein